MMNGWLEYWIDHWRVLNAALVMLAIVVDSRWLKRNWRELSTGRRYQMASLLALLTALFYGTLEQALFPQFTFRVPIFTVVVAFAVIVWFRAESVGANRGK